MITKLLVTIEDKKHIDTKYITIRGGATVNGTIQSLILKGFYVHSAIVSEWSRGIESNRRAIDLANYHQTH